MTRSLGMGRTAEQNFLHIIDENDQRYAFELSDDQVKLLCTLAFDIWRTLP